jgi:hypothetical protein
MRTLWLLAAAALLVSFAARATVIADDGFVTVYYEGRVESRYGSGLGTPCTICPYDVGDVVSGTLLIDLAKAPPDLVPEEEGIGQYNTLWSVPGPHSPSFVSGYARNRGDSIDSVQVIDDFEHEPGLTLYDVGDGQDYFVTENGRKGAFTDALGLRANSVTLDFLDGDGIVQDFDLSTELTSGEVPSSGLLYVARQWLDDRASFVQGSMFFALTRLTVKPGRCSI